ncbi:MAG TPA: hypothetical protein PK605_14680 [Ignavibacteria bacterium]|nr:hypothetical protein [Ignavibacteria bacterium]HRF66950.1 hypothetical protein [Ignavibacteria bacterium]HRJ05645.1 hypothetical protein [Ignavibacteria bacterium]
MLNLNDMFEHSKTRLASKKEFRTRLYKFTLISFLIFFISLSIGILGYHYLAELGWVDSFVNASMILGGMGPVDQLRSNEAKIFAGCYSLFSGVAFLSAMAIFLTPILHRFLHKFHLDTDSEGNIV